MLDVSVAVTDAETVPLIVSLAEPDGEGLTVWPRTLTQSMHMTAENLRKGPIRSIDNRRVHCRRRTFWLALTGGDITGRKYPTVRPQLWECHSFSSLVFLAGGGAG